MFRVKAFWLPKSGSTSDEYEDAYAFTEHPIETRVKQRFAIADGATETSFSGLWATALVQNYVSGGFDELTIEALIHSAKNWTKQIEAIRSLNTLSWYAEEKLLQGAYSSFLGLEISADGSWRAICVGDSCMFHIRDSALYMGFPLDDPLQFNNRPALISTNTAANEGVVQQKHEGTWQRGDYFFLMTDALAQFYLSEKMHRKHLFQVQHPDGFASRVRYWRDNQLCRNDDVTFLRIQMYGSPTENARVLADVS